MIAICLFYVDKSFVYRALLIFANIRKATLKKSDYMLWVLDSAKAGLSLIKPYVTGVNIAEFYQILWKRSIFSCF